MTLEGKADSGCHPEAEPKDPFCSGRDLPAGRRLLMRFLAALGMTPEGKADSGCHPEAKPKDLF